MTFVANLQQNPTRRPVIANWLPALLRQGTMFLMGFNCSTNIEERWLMDSVTRLTYEIRHCHFVDIQSLS